MTLPSLRAHAEQPTARASVVVRSAEDDPAVAWLVSLSFGGAEAAVHGRDAILAALVAHLVRGERVVLTPQLEVLPADAVEVASMRAVVALHDPGARTQAAMAPSLSSPQDAHLLGLRLDRPMQGAARAVYAAFLGVDERDLRGTEGGGVWRWYPSDRTARWAPMEGAPWSRRWRASRAACATPDELWERLVARGILPQDIVDGASRAFMGRAQRNEAPDTGEVPRSLTAALALASDADGIRSAEALAKEAVLALAPWTGNRPRRVSWVDRGAVRTDRRGRWYSQGTHNALVLPRALWELIERTDEATGQRRPYVVALERAALAGRPEVAVDIVEAHLAWRRWCVEDRAVPSRSADWPVVHHRWGRHSPSTTGHLAQRWTPPEGLAGRRFRELPDPTRPLLGILALGYTPSVVSEADATLVHPTSR